MNTNRDVTSEVTDYVFNDDNTWLRASVNDLMLQSNILNSRAALDALNVELEQSGVLPHLLLTERERLDLDHSGAIERPEMIQIVQEPGEFEPITAFAAQYALENFDEIRDAYWSVDDWSDNLEEDELRAFAELHPLAQPAPQSDSSNPAVADRYPLPAYATSDGALDATPSFIEGVRAQLSLDQSSHTDTSPEPENLPREIRSLSEQNILWTNMDGSVTVVVQKGDCLWSLAERTLSLQLNRPPLNAEIQSYVQSVATTIEAQGGDPDLIHPGDTYSFR